MSGDFDAMVAEAEAVNVSGWDFGWLEGRATEQRPSWGYQRLVGDRLASVGAALDIQTGGGEVLAGVKRFPPTLAATESWPPNVALAARRLHPRGVVVVADPDEPPLPFAGDSFDLVTSRHPATVWWQEIARVLRLGGTYLAQHVGPESASELYEFFLGPQPHGQHSRHPDRESTEAVAVGLRIETLRMERLRMEFFDIGAVVYFLRKVVWTVPDFSVQRYRDRLLDLHERIGLDGRFVAHSSRVLIEAEAPAQRTPAWLPELRPRQDQSAPTPTRPAGHERPARSRCCGAELPRRTSTTTPVPALAMAARPAVQAVSARRKPDPSATPPSEANAMVASW